MKFKAKPKLTPEILKQRLSKVKKDEYGLVFKTINISNRDICHSDMAVKNLIKSINDIINPNPNYKKETHCDADFY